MEVREKVDKRGFSYFEYTLDLSEANEILETLGQDFDVDEDGPCRRFRNDEVRDYECSFQKGVARMSGRIDRNAMDSLAIEGKKYVFNVTKALDEISFDDYVKNNYRSSPAGRSREIDWDNMTVVGESLMEMGVEMDYIVEMPGTVVYQTGGRLMDDGTVHFNLLDMPQTAFVESRLTGWELQWLKPVLAAILVAAAIYTAIVKSRETPGPVRVKIKKREKIDDRDLEALFEEVDD